MQDRQSAQVDAGQIAQWFWEYRWRWALPAAVVTIAATAFALLKPSEWDASQALTIRNEAANNEDGPGKFGHSDERRTAQETVLELAKSRAVLAAALQEVGPPARPRKTKAPWPSAKEIDDFRDNVSLTPPKGAELGRTEVFYLTVRDRDRRRAVALVNAVRDQLEDSYQGLRDATAQSMSSELLEAVEMARERLAEATARVTRTEAEVGEDLGDLRMLHESITGETSLQRSATEIRNELRQVQTNRRSTEELIGLLREAQEDPRRLVTTPNRLIESQPGLRRLKEGLIDAQLRTAALRGRMSEIHPLVVSAREAEQEVRRNIHAELRDAISGLQLEERLQVKQEESLNLHLDDLDRRLDQLAALRATYGAQLAEMANRTEQLRQAEDDLAQAEATQVGADAASLIGRIDVPTVGTKPAGPGRKLIVLVGMVGGMLAGLGLLVLTAPMPGGETVDSRSTPEVVVVVDRDEKPQVRETRPIREEPPKAPNAMPSYSPPSPEPATACARRQSPEHVRIPEFVTGNDESDGMTLKDALQRVGSAPSRVS